MNWSQTTFIWRQQQQQHTNTLNLVLWHAVTILCVFSYLLSPLKKGKSYTLKYTCKCLCNLQHYSHQSHIHRNGTEGKKFFSMSVKNVCGENYKFRVHTTNKWQQTHRTKAHRNNCGNKFLYEYHENGSPWHTLMLFLSRNRQKKKMKSRKLQSSPSLNSYVYPV